MLRKGRASVLTEKYRDHALTGDWSKYRDCHIKPDLVLIYRKPDTEVLQLVAKDGIVGEVEQRGGGLIAWANPSQGVAPVLLYGVLSHQYLMLPWAFLPCWQGWMVSCLCC